MKRPSRSVNIFNLSALDLFASAMGAFLIIALVLFPYFKPSREDLEDPFVIVIMKWKSSGDDIDMRVTTPQGNLYYYKAQEFQNEPDARFEEDTTHGPGNEVWIHRKAKTGRYKLEYVFWSDRDKKNPVTVSGYIVHTDGRIPIPDKALPKADTKKHYFIGHIVVDDNGKVYFEKAP